MEKEENVPAKKPRYNVNKYVNWTKRINMYRGYQKCPSNINELPCEILIKIFNCFEMKECIQLASVCTNWHNIIVAILSENTYLTQNHFPKGIVTDHIFKVVLERYGGSLQYLAMNQFEHSLTPNALASIAQYCPKLTAIVIDNIHVTNSQLTAVLTNCKQLKHITVISRLLEENNLYEVLPVCNNLVSLSIEYNTINDGQCLSYLSYNLRKLRLKSCYGLLYDGLVQLQGCIYLRELSLQLCSFLKTSTLNFICNCFSFTLKKLELIGNSDGEVSYIQVEFDRLFKLKELGIARSNLLTDHVLKAILDKCLKLRVLNISKTQVTAVNTLQWLSKYPKITNVNISYLRSLNPIDARKAMSDVGHLNALTIRNCSWVTNRSCLDLILNSNALCYLDVSSCSKINDDIIPHLKQQDRIKKLTLIVDDTRVTNFVVSPMLDVIKHDLCPPHKQYTEYDFNVKRDETYCFDESSDESD